MLRHWRPWILTILLVGPVVAYVGFGTLWLFEHGWLVVAGSLWVASGLLFTVLAARWTKAQNQVMPPIDWEAPRTFAQIDRDAWALVEEEADESDRVSYSELMTVDCYVKTGMRLAKKLAEHYHPLSTDPIENVPIVDLLTAFELAAEDLNHLCRQIPGGDLLTPSHWKRAVQVAGYLQRANDIYAYLLPIFNPVSGLIRLGARQWLSRPAWKDMQQNVLRWFFRAYVNRIGTHLIELYSGRLALGAERYRRLTRKGHRPLQEVEGELPPIRIAVAGAEGAGKARLIELLEHARSGEVALLRSRLAGAGIDEAMLDGLKTASLVAVDDYPKVPAADPLRDRRFRDAVRSSVEADLLIIVIDARLGSENADSAFALAWDQWFVAHPEAELPPALVVLSGVDDPNLGAAWSPPYDWVQGQGPREVAARAKLTALRNRMPPSVVEIVPVGIAEKAPFGVIEHLLPALLAQFHRAERAALIRHLGQVSRQSKAGRLMTQVGERGRWLWKHLRRSSTNPAESSGG